MKYLYVFADMLKDMPGQHGANPEAQPVIQAGGRTVEHHPEPDQRLALSILLGIHVAVAFRLQRAIARIKVVNQSLLSQGSAGAGICIRPTQIELMQRITDPNIAMFNIAV